jgi:hypothetical protein
MQPMAARLGIDHQRPEQFITSSAWDYAADAPECARWSATSHRRGDVVKPRTASKHVIQSMDMRVDNALNSA